MFNMHLTIGPITVTIVQMFVLALGAALALAVFNSVTKTWTSSKLSGFLATVPVILLFVFIAFFKISEMGLLEFVSKFFRTYFFDSARKFQTNFPRFDAILLLIAKHSSQDQKQLIESKTLALSKKDLDQIQNSWLL